MPKPLSITFDVYPHEDTLNGGAGTKPGLEDLPLEIIDRGPTSSGLRRCTIHEGVFT